ncbi:MAG: hypothetical protein COS99_08795 [Candidatus Omnitrophica bacterium CG07_land_8_20_14_0_80_42_15]|uniref:SGNH/GDSL hydrolase family protein n=1 Tax=Candidatus Aquitaenariimonas noxiae TaxID=1974741 RepID=A0A2J0L0Q9_9BACT|nr:MAG: hypothetical protein COS99_08795 [Candidatus Omnitrophica bacterium CG07_land_8_20_14_0_80_42_15]
MKEQRQRKKISILVKAAISFIVSILVIIFLLFRYTSILHKLYCYEEINSPAYKERIFPKLSISQAANLGGAHIKVPDTRRSSYSFYPEQKKTGTIRIGLFGCSFIEGAEIASDYDVPSLLQARFNKAGINDIEVINFGLGGRGVDSMCLLWEFLGKNYDLDYVVFSVFAWHRRRDNSFIFPDAYDPVHARYIVENGNLKLIPVLGSSSSEACAIYNRLIPPWRYIRYENKMPLFLKVLLPQALHQRTNPFYYKIGKSKKEEQLEIYSMLVTKLASQVKNLIIVANDDEIYRLKEKIHSNNVYIMKSYADSAFKNFLYEAPKGHNSALGNQVRADELFSLFMGHGKPTFKIIDVFFDMNSKKGDFKLSRSPLNKYDNISMNIGKYPVASFLKNRNKPYCEGLGNDLDFQKSRVSSLVFTSTNNAFPLPVLLQHDEQIYLSFKVNDNLIKIPIGDIRASTDIAGTLIQKTIFNRHIFSKGPNYSVEFQYPDISLDARGKVSDICVIIGDKVIFQRGFSFKDRIKNFLYRLILDKERVFLNINTDEVYLAAKPGQGVCVDELKEKEGVIDLVLSNKDGYEERYPILSYKINTINALPFDPIFPDPISQQVKQNDSYEIKN